MLHAFGGALELRENRGEAVLAGSFPYNAETELAPGRFEQIGSRAFERNADVYLLAQHDFHKPLASTSAHSLTLVDGADALAFEARIAPDVAGTSHARDTLALIRSGLAIGLSPGFRVRPDGETVERRSDGGILRTIRSAILFELSIVTRAAYPAAEVQARSWQAPVELRPGRIIPAVRWR